MTMTSFLILATWIVLVVSVTGLGMLLPQRFFGAAGLRDRLLGATWLGTCGLVLLACLLSLVIPLGGVLAGCLLGILVLVGCMTFIGTCWQRRSSIRSSWVSAIVRRRWATLAFLGLLAFGIVLASRFAVAEPTDADFGLYRMNQIFYAEQFRVIPGLANLHDRFGFNSSAIPTAALLGHGLWAGLGYRVVTGLFLALLAWTIVLRVLVPRRGGSTAGDWATVVGATFIGAIAIRDTGRWIASPGQDLIFAIVAVASLGFLLDAVASRGDLRWSGAAAIATAALCGTVRPLGWALWISTVVVLGCLRFQQQRPRVRKPQISRIEALALIAGGALILSMLARDAFSSGWLLYPSSFFPLPVPWRAPDPSLTAQAITDYARAPMTTDPELLADGGWFRPWLASFLGSWEVRSLALVVLSAAIPLLWRRGRQVWRHVASLVILAVIPSVAVVGLWFVTAPDVRFGWAGLIGVVAVPLAFLLAAGAYDRSQFQAMGITVIVMSLLAASGAGLLAPRGREPEARQARIGPVPVTLFIASPRKSEALAGRLGDGTPIIYPQAGDNWCAELFPLCLMNGTGGSARSLGDSIQDGFGQLNGP